MLFDSSHILLAKLKIVGSNDIVHARQCARQIATLLNFDLQAQTRIATVVSEIARNAYQYAKDGEVEYWLTKEMTTPRFIIKVCDQGSGISNLSQILEDHLSKSVKGLGIIGSKRIMDKFTINSSAETGTEVIAEMYLSRAAPVITSELLAKVNKEVICHQANNVIEEVHQQNHELLQALALQTKSRDELDLRVKERTEQLITINEELKQQIEERKRIEEWIQQHQLDISRAERINLMNEMASVIAHELNQPLAAITLYAQGCIRRLKSQNYKIEELLNVMNLVAKQSERAGEIMHRLKDFARKGKLSIESANINKLLKETITFMRHKIEKRQVTIEFKLNDYLPILSLDSIQFQQAITNLVRNAIQAMNEGGIKLPKIIITTDIIDSHNVEINIIDNGPGFSVDNPQILLEPYFTTKKDGMGIGLSISRTIIEAHGGKLLAKHNPQGGAWFQIELPVNGVRK